MLAAPLYPLRFEPILKELIWGGRRLETVLGKTLGAGAHYAESWEIADHGDDVSRVVEGLLRGASLRDLIRQRGVELLGAALGPRDQFPLLVKFLDADQMLSVQVHPDDALGRKLAGDNGKTEAWVVLHAEPGSQIYAGLQPGVTRDAFAAAIAGNAVEPLLHHFEPKAGDCVLIPAGTVHALGAGVVVAEIQQMSDATFRVYDWGRLGADGKPRALHIAAALEATDYTRGPVHPLTPQPEPIEDGVRERLAQCPYFALERLRLGGPTRVGSTERFTILLGLGGTAEVWHDAAGARLELGQTLILPAALGECTIAPAEAGDAVVLSCVVP